MQGLENIDGVAYFVLTHPALGSEPWTSDGSPERTGLLKDILLGPGDGGPQGGPRPFVAFDAAVYFFADDGIAGTEVWSTDGTAAGTALFADLVPGPEGFTSGRLSASDGRLYITGFRAETGGQLFVIEASP